MQILSVLNNDHQMNFWNINTILIRRSNGSRNYDKMHWLGKIEEWFFDFGQTRFRMQGQLLDGRISVIKDQSLGRSNHNKTAFIALKVAISFSVIGVLGMLLARVYYRKINTFAVQSEFQRREIILMEKLKNNLLDDIKNELKTEHKSFNLNFHQDGYTLLIRAILSQDPELVALMLESNNNRLDINDKSAGLSPLLITIAKMTIEQQSSAKENFKKIAILLCKAGADMVLAKDEVSILINRTMPNSSSEDKLATALHIFSSFSEIEVMEEEKKDIQVDFPSPDEYSFANINLLSNILPTQTICVD